MADLIDFPRPPASPLCSPPLTPSDYVAAEFWRGVGQGIGIASGMLLVGGVGYLVVRHLNTP